MKHGANNTFVSQLCDSINGSRGTKKSLKHNTYAEAPRDEEALGRVRVFIDTLVGGRNPERRRDNFVQLLHELQHIIPKTYAIDKCTSGVARTGLGPNWSVRQALRTVKDLNTWSQTKFDDLITNNLDHFINIVQQKGYITDKDYDERGFPNDALTGNKVIDRMADRDELPGRSQRAMIISHPNRVQIEQAQKALWEQRKADK